MLPAQNCFWSFSTHSLSSFQSESRSWTTFFNCSSETFGATSMRTVSPIWPVAASASSFACISARGNHSRSTLIVGFSFSQLAMKVSYQSFGWPGVPWIQSGSRTGTTPVPAAGLAAAAAASVGLAAGAAAAVVGHPGNVQYYINKTMIEKAGLKVPPADGNWSYEDLMTISKGLTKSEGGRTTVFGYLPGLSDTTANEYIVGMLRAFGGDLFDADGKKSLLNTPESIAALKVIADLYKAGVCYPWAADIQAQRPGLFQGQKVGIMTMTSAAAASWPDQIAKLPEPFEMDVVPNPLGTTGKHATQVSSDGKGVSASTKVPQQAWMVLSRLYTGQKHGVERFKNGLGSPGSRNDVWDSDEFRQKAPKLQNIAKYLVLPPSPEMPAWHHPANGRFAEHEPILLNEFIKVSLGQLDVEKYAQDVGKQIQEILDKPPV